ncbi:MAG TPA: type II secretion system F family protein [Polyangiales bacterium]
MAEWVWEARARTGETKKGTMEAETADAVQGRLRAQNLNPVKVKKKPTELKIPLPAFLEPKVTAKEIVIFIRQFATMIDAGLPLVQCLEILSTQGDNPTLNKILRDVKSSVEQGATFSDALARHPKVFDSLFCSLIRAGEMGGILDTILGRLAIYIEKNVKLARQVKGALTYPLVTFGIALSVCAVLLGWVVPTFEQMFKDFGGELPAMTAFVIGISNGFLSLAPVLAGGLIAFVYGCKYTYNHPKTRPYWHKAMLTVPILGPVMRKVAVARFTRTLGTLLSSGVPILDALDVVAASAGNVIIENAIRFSADKIREGRTMAEPLAESGVFPAMVVQMIGVGEQTGALDQMLNKIADFYEEEVDVAVAAMTSMIEPIMMVGVGGMVGFLLIAMYMPIFDIAGKVSEGSK